MARQHRQHRQQRRRKEKSNSSCWVNLIWFILLTVGASVLYEYVTGEELPWVGVHIGDAIDRLPDAGGLGDSIGGAIGGAVDKIPDFDIGNTINDLKDRLPKFNLTGLIDRINIPDFGFDFDDIFTFDDGNIFGGGNRTDGNGTALVKMIGWNNNKITKNDIFGSYNKNKVGLTLHIANALTNDWHYYFNKAVSDWEHGSPDNDMLTIETSIVDVDPECTPEFDMMKVCNSNYGKTGWKGINEMLIQGDYIVASVAKMNEYYVSETVRNSGSERQYTMCHEIGHGFGLPHLDENFYNADLNSCMDYSSRPQNNLQPSPADFASLNILYGVDANGRNAGNRNGWWRRRQRGRHLRSRDQNYVHDKNYVHNGVLVERRVYYLPA